VVAMCRRTTPPGDFSVNSASSLTPRQRNESSSVNRDVVQMLNLFGASNAGRSIFLLIIQRSPIARATDATAPARDHQRPR
jgi:hypothetical protein